jgi:hypothetical protein
VQRLIEIVTFRRMIAPIMLQLLFWAGIGGTLYGTYVLYELGNQAWPLPLVFGTLVVRVLFEMALLAFRIYDRLGEISTRLGGPA